MNTDRDNFHDWARDKPETAFSTISRAEFLEPRGARHPGVRWGRLFFLAVVASAIGAGVKFLVAL